MTQLRFTDESAIRELYGRMLGAWGDAQAYAECFTPDADYIIGLRWSPARLVADHRRSQRRLLGLGAQQPARGRIERLRFLTSEVALLIGHGHVVYLDHRSSDQNKRTVYSLVALRRDEHWLFAAYQNTPLGGH